MDKEVSIMGEQEKAMHFVCTYDEAEELIDRHRNFWVSNCGCREGKGECRQSRKDVCLDFSGTFGGTGSDYHTVSREFVDELMQEARDKRLVTRPFRDYETKTTTQGICFCCNDCCGYFVDQNEVCDKGKFIEETDYDCCSDCGLCVDVCYFKARKINEEGRLEVDREQCYGCGLCNQICPVECIEMIKR